MLVIFTRRYPQQTKNEIFAYSLQKESDKRSKRHKTTFVRQIRDITEGVKHSGDAKVPKRKEWGKPKLGAKLRCKNEELVNR